MSDPVQSLGIQDHNRGVSREINTDQEVACQISESSPPLCSVVPGEEWQRAAESQNYATSGLLDLSPPYRVAKSIYHYTSSLWPTSAEKDLNRAVADRVYDENVYTLDSYDILLLPLVLKGLRAGSRWLLPTLTEAAVSADHPEIRDQILSAACYAGHSPAL